MSAERIWASSAVAGLSLWDDEAETALLAKNTSRFGVPVAWGGVSLISQEPAAKQGAERTLQYLKTGIPESAYRRIDLPVIDTVWGNIPEPDRHVFRDPGNWPRRISLYEKARP